MIPYRVEEIVKSLEIILNNILEINKATKQWEEIKIKSIYYIYKNKGSKTIEKYY